ncbi:hypothetical protein ACWEV3_19885 [Saccharopolyspora sp. NPDC003752]
MSVLVQDAAQARVCSEAVTAALGEGNVDQAEAIFAEPAQCLARRRRSSRILGRL